jgi:hypothetical protein
MWFTPAQLGWLDRCTYSAERIEIAQTEVRLSAPDQSIPFSGTIPAGSYCASESLVVSASGVRGTISGLAPEIAVNGENLELTPFTQDVLFFSVPNTDNDDGNDGSLGADGNPFCVPAEGNDLVLNGSGHRWSGIVFDPCGRVVVNAGGGAGGGAALTGAVVGERVRVVGDGFSMVGKGDFQYTTALVE